MKLSTAIAEKKLDLRLREKAVHEGKLTKDELATYLNSLPDDSDSMTFTEDEKKDVAPTQENSEPTEV